MSQIAVVYWSGTGNTQTMAEAVVSGVNQAGGQALLLSCETFDPETMEKYEGIAFGCPAMGAEELEESVFAPMFEQCLPYLEGKRIGLFGSYGWGDGEWMRSWEERCVSCGAVLCGEPVICQDAPDEETTTLCEQLGKDLLVP